MSTKDLRSRKAFVRLGAGLLVGLAVTATAACSNSVSGTASSSTGSSAGAAPSSGAAGGKKGADSPKAAVQTLVEGVKEVDAAKIESITCDDWPSITGKGRFVLNDELDPPAQRGFAKGTVGEPRQSGDGWEVPVTMPVAGPSGDEQPETATVKVIKQGGGYLTCGFEGLGG